MLLVGAVTRVSRIAGKEEGSTGTLTLARTTLTIRGDGHRISCRKESASGLWTETLGESGLHSRSPCLHHLKHLKTERSSVIQ
jgi:hypothetical protein